MATYQHIPRRRLRNKKPDWNGELNTVKGCVRDRENVLEM